MQENTNITTINNEREIEEDGNSGQVTSQNCLGMREKRREISENKYSAMSSTL
jgi:1,4-dihydroxy-2-naphthoate octaprenyltransferase